MQVAERKKCAEGVCPSVQVRKAVSFPGCPIVYEGAYFGVEVRKTTDDAAHAVQVSCACCAGKLCIIVDLATVLLSLSVWRSSLETSPDPCTCGRADWHGSAPLDPINTVPQHLLMGS